MLTPVGLKNFTQEVIRSEQPVLVDFWAPGCRPCQTIKPVLESVARQGAKVVTVDIGEEPELAQHYAIQGVPTVVLFKGGKPGNRVVGLKSVPEIQRLLVS